MKFWFQRNGWHVALAALLVVTAVVVTIALNMGQAVQSPEPSRPGMYFSGLFG